MKLDDWLARNEMEVTELARIIGVSRQTLWKIRNGEACTPETAEKIYFVTGGSVKPQARTRGFPKGQKRKLSTT